jgi:hypothetical protein
VWGKSANGERLEKKGSLILGNRAPDPEKEGKDEKDNGQPKKEKRLSKWFIKIDKEERNQK